MVTVPVRFHAAWDQVVPIVAIHLWDADDPRRRLTRRQVEDALHAEFQDRAMSGLDAWGERISWDQDVVDAAVSWAEGEVRRVVPGLEPTEATPPLETTERNPDHAHP